LLSGFRVCTHAIIVSDKSKFRPIQKMFIHKSNIYFYFRYVMQYLYLFLLGGKLKIHFALSQAKYLPQCQ